MTLDIPGRGSLSLNHVVFDFNGTLAVDGALVPALLPLFRQVMGQYQGHILTADTFGTVKAVAKTLDCTVSVIRSGEDKARYVEQLRDGAVAVGNGTNDTPMFRAAQLAIAILGQEGASSQALLAADVVVTRIHDALELLLNPARLVATLRP